MVLRCDGWNGKNNQDEFTLWLDGVIEDLYQIAGTHDSVVIKEKLREIIPEYVPQQDIQSVLKSFRFS